ncbi:MAG: SRPBCC domain-containing protein [Kiloniellaceae bacterium]
MAKTSAAAEPQATGAVLRLTRRFAAPREAVFDALTRPEALSRWFGPDGITARNVRVDLRPGGRYSLEMHSAEGEIYRLSGTYREVRPPDKLVLTWVWAEGDYAGIETLVTIELRDAAGGTAFTLSHEGLPSDEARARHTKGWTSSFGCLDRFLKDGETS